MKKLIDITTGREIKVGDRVRTFRGESGTLISYKEPCKISGVCPVCVKLDIHGGITQELYSTVINAEFHDS
jgi:hypothetical protein